MHDINLDIFVENKVNFYSYLQVHHHLHRVHHMIPSASIGSPVVFHILLFQQASCSSITIKNSHPLELYHFMTAKAVFMTYLTTWLENRFGKKLNISSVMIHNFSRNVHIDSTPRDSTQDIQYQKYQLFRLHVFKKPQLVFQLLSFMCALL